MINRNEQQQDAQRTTDFMERNRVFTVEEFARYLGREKCLAEYHVRYYLKQGRLRRLAKCVYTTVPVGVARESDEPDAFLAAAAIRPDAIFAYHSALDLLGQGHSVWWVGGLDELVESMDGFATLNPDPLQEILRAYDNRRLWAAVGWWYLQRRLEDIFLDASILGDFQKHRSRIRVYLVPGQRGGVLARDWNLIVPEHL